MINKSFKLILSFILIIAGNAITSAQTFKDKKCLSYESAEVSLRGKLTRKVVINASDQKETIWVIKLDQTVCLAADPENEINSGFERVVEMQLVLNKEQFAKHRGLINQNITVTGTLFAGHTQHHFTEVLMIVTDMKKDGSAGKTRA